MYRVTRTFEVSRKPPRFEAAAATYDTQSEAETAYVRACHIAGTQRVCLDVTRDDGRWCCLVTFALR